MREIPVPRGYLVSAVQTDSEGHSVSLECPCPSGTTYTPSVPEDSFEGGQTQSCNLKNHGWVVFVCVVLEQMNFVDDNIMLHHPEAGACLELKRTQALGP